MRARYIILLIIGAIVIGYVFGQFAPVEIFHPTITSKEISLNDIYTRAVSLVGAFATVIATLVALFKEDIKRLYENANLSIGYKDTEKLLEVTDLETGGNPSNPIVANKYEVKLHIHNTGKLAARGCQIYLEQLTFTAHGQPNPKNIEPSGKPLQWQGKTESTIVIPSKAKSYVTAVEILSPQSAIVGSNDGTPTSPQLRIAGLDSPLPAHHGIYKCHLTVYSESSGPVQFVIHMQWDGKWHQRITEMRSALVIS